MDKTVRKILLVGFSVWWLITGITVGLIAKRIDTAEASRDAIRLTATIGGTVGAGVAVFIMVYLYKRNIVRSQEEVASNTLYKLSVTFGFGLSIAIMAGGIWANSGNVSDTFVPQIYFTGLVTAVLCYALVPAICWLRYGRHQLYEDLPETLPVSGARRA